MRGFSLPLRQNVFMAWFLIKRKGNTIFDITNITVRNLYRSSHFVGVVTSRTLRWAGHVIRMGETENRKRILIGIHIGRRPLEDRKGDGRVTLSLMFGI
jgi:hypothetical protein